MLAELFAVVGGSCIEIELRAVGGKEREEGMERREGGTLYRFASAKFLCGENW